MLDLKYYLFDWDDNILYMPTKIHLEKDGKPISLTTKEYAHIRTDSSYKPQNGDWDYTFREFSDDEERTNFRADVIDAIKNKAFAPSFETFKETLIAGRLFCIVSARGNSSEAIRRGVEALFEYALTEVERKQMISNIQKFNYLAKQNISNELALLKYLDLCGYIGVSAPDFLQGQSRGAANPEEGKKRAIRLFVRRILAIIESSLGHLAGTIAFGFSDDDKKNVEKVREFMSTELKDEYPNIKFRIFDTSDGVKKIKV